MRPASLKALAIALGVAFGFPLVGCSSSSEQPAPGPPYTGDPGPYRIGHVSYVVTDAARSDRPVAINVWYPADPAAISTASPARYPYRPAPWASASSSSGEWEALGYDRAYEQPAASPGGPFPLVVLSPGYNTASWLYVGLAARLASHGYVTAVLDHYREDGWGPSGGVWFLQECMFHRPRDISFAITDLLARSDAPDGLLHGTIDASRIAAGGHSLGGYAALALAGGDDLVCDSEYAVAEDGSVVTSTCQPTPTDARIKAVISLDSATQFLRYAELARISTPSLLMGETVATLTTVLGSPYETWNARPHAAIQRPDSYRVDVERAQHGSFANLCDGLLLAVRGGWTTDSDAAYWRIQHRCASAISPAEAHQVMTRYVVAFLNVHLRGSTADAVTLTPADAATHAPAVQFIDSEACSASLPDETYFSYRTLQTGGVCAFAKKDPVEFFAPP